MGDLIAIANGPLPEAERVYVSKLDDAPKFFGFNKCARLMTRPEQDISVLEKFVKRIPVGETLRYEEEGIPHYLLSISARTAAISLGAMPINDGELMVMINDWVLVLVGRAATGRGVSG